MKDMLDLFLDNQMEANSTDVSAQITMTALEKLA
jgi:hypothetical protein